MSTELSPSASEDTRPHLQVAHVLFMDMIGYSRLHIDLQKTLAGELQDIVMATQEFTRAIEEGALICRPTGDGMALIFLNDMLAPLRCALEIAYALRARPRIKIRMGLHSGPLYIVTDINGMRDVHGDGIVMAQRVMDCGDDDHILISSGLAAMLSKVKPWALYLTHIGECAIKHGETIQIYNLVSKEFGNPRFPKKVVAQRMDVIRPVVTPISRPPEEPPVRALTYLALFLLIACGLLGTGWLVSPPFRALCQTAFHFHVGAAQASTAPPRSPSDSAVSDSRDTPAASPVAPPSSHNNTSGTRTAVSQTKHAGKTQQGSRLGTAPETLPVLAAAPPGDADADDSDTSPLADDDTPHEFHAEARLPDDGKATHMVHVVYTDKTGRHESEDTDKAGGDILPLDFTYQGPSLTLQISYGGHAEFIRKYTIPPSDIIQL